MHENNGAAIYVGSAVTLHNPLHHQSLHNCFNVHTIVEYLNKNASIGQLL